MSPKIGYILRPTRKWPEKSLEQLLAELQEAKKELAEAVEAARPFNQLVSQADTKRREIEWEIYNIQVIKAEEQRKATMRTEDDPIGCPAEYKGAWGGKGKSKTKTKPVRVTKEMEEAL